MENKTKDKPKIKQCSYCGKEFEDNRSNRKYCSKDCYKAVKKVKRREYYKKSKSKIKQCIHCGKTFEFTHANQKHCSNICYEIEKAEQKKANEELRKRKTQKIENEEVEYINKFILAPAGYETEIKKGKFKFYNGKISKNMDLYYRHMFIEREPTMLRKLSESSMSDKEITHYHNIKEIQIYKKV